MFSFLNPLFLFAAASVIIPVVLHMIQSHRTVKLPFSTIRFLKMAQQNASRRIRMEHFLLWLLRTLLLLAIVIGGISRDSGGGIFLVELLGGSIPYWLLPVALQLLTLIIAFSKIADREMSDELMHPIRAGTRGTIQHFSRRGFRTTGAIGRPRPVEV